MQTEFVDWTRNSDFGKEAEEIIHKCVHCGFCLATCPSYQIMGDELDSPRGRIYQIKQILEGHEPSYVTQQHLDRCLTCRNCETTCPSGVKYGNLIDIGRKLTSEKVQRPWRERAKFSLLRTVLTSKNFANLYKLGLFFQPVLPKTLQAKLNKPRSAGHLPVANHQRKVIMLANCVQPAMMPSIDAAMQRVLNALSINTSFVVGSGCCGAINFHLDAQEKAKQQMRTNIDAWLPKLESGEYEAIVINASGCGAMIKDYAQHLKYDKNYATKAQKLIFYVKDIAEYLALLMHDLQSKLKPIDQRYTFHPPCTLQHWQGLRVTTERLLTDLGFNLLNFEESHLCCGSAGTYSVTQPKISLALRDRKIDHIAAAMPDTIISANIGCICHLQGGTNKPVKHWIEVVDEALNE